MINYSLLIEIKKNTGVIFFIFDVYNYEYNKGE